MRPSPRLLAALGFAAVLCATSVSHAQLLNQLQSAAPSVSMPSVPTTGALGALGGGGVPSVTSASPSNIAGLLQYCIQNNDVSGASASSVQSQLMQKLGGGTASDPGYGAGQGGTLQTGAGQGLSLGGSGIKQEMTRKVCNMVLQHAQSML